MIYVDFRNEVTDRLKSRYSPKGWKSSFILKAIHQKIKLNLSLYTRPISSTLVTIASLLSVFT